MKDFKKENFDYSGGYLTYEGKFVARFKYRGPITMAKFRNFLIKKFLNFAIVIGPRYLKRATNLPS